MNLENKTKQNKSQTCTQKRSWSLFGVLMPVWSTTAFWILVKPLYLRSMLSRSMRCIPNYNTCRWRWSTEWAQFFSMTIPMHMSHNQKVLVVWHTASKVEQIGLQSFASSTIFTWPLADQLLQTSQQLFAREMLPQPTGGRKCFPRVYWIPKHGFLCYRNKQSYFSLAKVCWL